MIRLLTLRSGILRPRPVLGGGVNYYFENIVSAAFFHATRFAT